METILYFKTRGGRRWLRLEHDDTGYTLRSENGASYLGQISERAAIAKTRRRVWEAEEVDGIRYFGTT